MTWHQPTKQLKISQHQPISQLKQVNQSHYGHVLLNLKTKLKHKQQTTRARPRVKEGEKNSKQNMKIYMNQLQSIKNTIQKIPHPYQLPNSFHELNMARYAHCNHIVTTE
jgi:hypothetical protein